MNVHLQGNPTSKFPHKINATTVLKGSRFTLGHSILIRLFSRQLNLKVEMTNLSGLFMISVLTCGLGLGAVAEGKLVLD